MVNASLKHLKYEILSILNFLFILILIFTIICGVFFIKQNFTEIMYFVFTPILSDFRVEIVTRENKCLYLNSTVNGDIILSMAN